MGLLSFDHKLHILRSQATVWLYSLGFYHPVKERLTITVASYKKKKKNTTVGNEDGAKEICYPLTVKPNLSVKGLTNLIQSNVICKAL